MATSHRICILGGGFGGLYTALKLENFPWSTTGRPQITLIDQHERFVFLPFLYELITNEMQVWEIAPTFKQLLAKTSVQFVQDEVLAIDPQQMEITLKQGGSLSCDRLVLALGGETPLDRVPGAQEHAIPFRSLEDANRLKQRLKLLEQQPGIIQVAVVGAGPSGVELSCKLADRLGDRGRIRLIDRNEAILTGSSPYNQQAALKALQERQIQLDLNTDVTEVQGNALVLSRQTNPIISADLTLWTVGSTIPSVVEALTLPKNAQGQIQSEPTLQVQNHPHIFALGDLATGVDANGQAIPQTAQAAFQAADYAAWNLWASITGRNLLPFRYSHLGEMLTLGKDEAVLAGLGVTLDGPLANLARRAIYWYRFPTLEHQINVGLQWILKPFHTAYFERESS